MELVGGKKGIKEKMGQQSLMTQPRIHTEEIAPGFIRKQNGLMLVGIGKILQALEGCACPMGVLNREFLKKLSLTGDEVAIVDMEAGVEHFGRGIDENIDQMLVVVEPSFDALNLAVRIKQMAAGMHKRVSAVLNKAPSEEIAGKMEASLAEAGMDILGNFPLDPQVFGSSLVGAVPTSGAAFDTAGKVLERLLAK
jgi:CO dehydrogenase maturation factor